MNIKEFKENDIITRSEPIVRVGGADSSFCGERLIFIGVDEKSKVILLVDDMFGSFDLSYARDPYDEGWEYYPESLLQKAKNLVKSRNFLQGKK